MSDLKEKFLKHWADKKFVRPGQELLLAISGGLDSMAMANLFLGANIPFSVAHCNFGLRGADADADQSLVARWCTAHNKRFFAAHFDTNKEAATSGKSIQETARNLRYAWFYELLAAHHLAAIATAHHADDNAETMLINLCRGTGIAGLHGIPERNDKTIRPLLFATRNELADYVQEQQISYREDASNDKADYLRNAIRHRVLPVLEELMPGVAMRMLDTGSRIGEAENIYQKSIETERKKLLQLRGNDWYIPIKSLQHRKPLATLCYELMKPFGFTPSQTNIALALLNAESGKYIASPTHRLIRNRDFLVITALKEAQADMILVENFEQEIVTANGKFIFSMPAALPSQLENGKEIALIDASNLEQPVLLRRWKTGDYFYPLGMGMKKKKLGRFLTDQKIPLQDKEHIWVLEANKSIVWVAGLRLDERFKVSPATASVLKIKFTEG